MFVRNIFKRSQT